MMRKFVHRNLSLLTLFLAASICSFSQVTSNKGREFWVGYGHHQFMEQGNNAMNMRIYLSTDAQPATVTVSIDSSGNPFLPVNTIGGIWRKTYVIPPYTAIQTDVIPKGPTNVAAVPSDPLSDPYWDARLYDLPPESGGAGGSGVFRNKGIHIVSNVAITAYSHIYGSASSGATMLIPITAWGYEYVSLNSNQSYAANCYNWTYVIASKDNTVLQITPSVKTRGQNRTGLSPGVTSTVTLMKGQIYQLIGANENSDVFGNGGTSSVGLSLSGTRIKSIAGPGGECFPIAVFAGSSRTTNPASCGTGGGDNDNQQLFPMHSWGKRYLIAPFSPSTNPAGMQRNIVKVAFSEPPPATQLRRNGAVVPVPAGSLFYTFETTTADLITADKPIMVNQFMNGASTCLNGGVGDPEMVVVAPVEQAIKEVTFYRQSRQSITTNYLTLIVPTEGVASLRIDNSAAFDHTYPHPQSALMGKNYTVVVKRWNIGAGQSFQSVVRCDSAFNAITYGLGSVESYAYSAGALINNLNAFTGIHNQPDLGNGGQNLHQFTGVGTPLDLSILIKYQPERLTWKFSEMNPPPGACMTASPAIGGDFVMNPASNFADGTVNIGGTIYFKYNLPHTFTFNCPGIFEIPVEAYSPGINNCGNREMFYPAVDVREQPIADFTYLNTTMCSKDTLYLTGPASGLSGITPQTMVRWEWLLPGGLTATQKDTAIVLPPGNHEIRLVAITTDGLLTNTMVKNITIYPPPTTVLAAVPDVVCTGQTITFNQTTSYGGPALPITNYYWNFGDNTTLNNLNTSEVHTYAGPNTYTATAAVGISPLCISDTVEKIVIVSPEAQIDFSYPDDCLPASGLAQFGASATDMGGTPITTYTWDFGDPASGANNTSSQQNPTHTYTTFGTYNVTLSVVTNTGCAGDITVPLTFGPEPALAFPAFAPVCPTATPFSVATGTITNGVTATSETYTGPGVSGTTFDPAVAGVGTHTITYSVITPSCTETIDQTITVMAPPTVGAGNYGPVCVNATPVNLLGTPAGGTFSGAGVTGNTFNPATAGVGTHTITYNYTDANGCSNSTTTAITVEALPVVNAGTYAPVCIDGNTISLAGTPAGGTFSGPGVTGTSFNPATAGAGSHTITYSYTAAGGCSASGTATIVVNALPTVSAGTYTPVCVTASSITLAGTPAGGVFSGTGVTGTSFNPATAGAGTFTITYDYTDANGCFNSATTSITVNALPVVNAGTYAPVCVAAASPVTLAGTPAGGTFSGPGVTGTSFNPATAGSGTHTVTYNYTDANGCSNSATTDITVYALPVIDAGTYAPVCIEGTPVTLVGNPAGGTFSGPGVTGSTFNPATAGIGTHTITYTYTDPSSCSNSGTTTITVNAALVANAGTYSPLCIDAAALPLVGTPAGGTFSGTGVTANTFDPAIAGAGTHTITYDYTDANGCSASGTTTITVNVLPVVNAGTYAPVCIDGGTVALAGTPTGGTYSGPGVTGTSFNPATAGAGTHTINYSYTDANGCSALATTTITVNALPVVNAGTYAAVCSDAPAITLVGSPASGTFSGTGVTGSSFNPATAGPGTHTITYNYTDGNGCAASATTTITVNAIPVLDAGTYAPVCIDAAGVTLVGSPVGGTFSGPGVTGNTFNPATAGAGTHTISYGNVAGCNNSTVTTTITVNALPVVNAGTYAPVCIDGGAVALAGTPAGGTFTGTGVTGSSFNPATAGAGTHTINYSYTDANGCSALATTTITVNALPVVNAGTYAAVCSDAPAITLVGSPAGGTFSGTGVTGSSFNPATAGPGTHTITYNYTDGNGCAASATTTITVNAIPVLDAGTYAPVCIDAAGVTLVGSPAGGTFSGPGVTGNTFNPATAGAGTHTISYGNVAGCNNSTVTTTITVNALPVVNAGTYAPVCIDGGAVALAGTPAGGTFSGTGVTGSSFNPATAGVGSHTITYNYTDGNGCAASATTTITVNALPVVNAGTYAAVCSDAAAITLAGTPAGGTFSGTGVTGSSFNPMTAGAGTHTITYNYTDGNGCAASATTTITVNAIPTLDAGTYPPVCVDAAAVTLAGSPAGGTFSGPGVTGNTFNPAVAGAGTHTISYGGVAGCNNSTVTTTITVNALPVINAGMYAPICIDGGNVPLVGTPAGGTFSGPGVTGSTFNPSVAGAGAHTIIYTYSDANNCTNTGSTVITVHALPDPGVGTYAPVCVNAAPVTLTGTPAGGTFSGPGVTGNTFNPAVAGVGTHSITYSFTNANGCNATTSADIIVNDLPVVSAGNYTALCAELAPITLAGTPAGGTFSGPGVTGNTFNPTVAGAGIHTIVYTFTAATGCSQTNSTTIEVYPTPRSTFTLDNSICVDGVSTLQSTGTVATGNIVSWSWNLGDGNTPTYTNDNPFDVNYPTHNNYNVSLVTTSDMGCVSTTTTQTISVHPLPVAAFELPTGICMPQGIALFTNTTTVPDNSALSYVWDFGDLTSPSTTTNPSHTYASSGNYNVTLTATSAFGCINQTTQVLDDFYDKPIALFTVNPNEICQGSEVTLNNQSSDPNGSNLTYAWNFGDNTTSTEVSPPKTFTMSGDLEISLTVTNAVGCTSDEYVQPVLVHLQPVIDAGNSFVVPEGTPLQFNATANSNNLVFEWDPPTGLSDAGILRPTLLATQDETYTLTATGEFGCTASDFITVKILKLVKVPNVFSPNGDNIHDKWMIPNLADYPNATVEVFNRYGQQVFYSKGYNTPWDGRYKGKDLPVGAYYYVITLNSGFKPLNGSITILR